ncbi:MAG: hypothetical protein AABY14_01500, partial [Nanoarchaeota archaeon]
MKIIISPTKKVFRGLSCWRCSEAEPLASPRKTRRYRRPQKFITEKLLWLTIYLVLAIILIAHSIKAEYKEKIYEDYILSGDSVIIDNTTFIISLVQTDKIALTINDSILIISNKTC